MSKQASASSEGIALDADKHAEVCAAGFASLTPAHSLDAHLHSRITHGSAFYALPMHTDKKGDNNNLTLQGRAFLR